MYFTILCGAGAVFKFGSGFTLKGPVPEHWAPDGYVSNFVSILLGDLFECAVLSLYTVAAHLGVVAPSLALSEEEDSHCLRQPAIPVS